MKKYSRDILVQVTLKKKNPERIDSRKTILGTTGNSGQEDKKFERIIERNSTD